MASTDYNGPPEVAMCFPGQVMVHDIRCTKPVADIQCSVTPWCCAFGQAESRCLAIGFEDGSIKVVDMNSGCLIYAFKMTTGICSLQFQCADTTMLIAGCLKGTQHVVRLSSEEVVSHNNQESPCTIWSVDPSPFMNNTWLASNDHMLQLWSFDGSFQIMDAVGHLSQQPIKQICWSRAKKQLCAIASFDQVLSILLINC